MYNQDLICHKMKPNQIIYLLTNHVYLHLYKLDLALNNQG